MLNKTGEAADRQEGQNEAITVPKAKDRTQCVTWSFPWMAVRSNNRALSSSVANQEEEKKPDPGRGLGNFTGADRVTPE
jgi:hypothetical protein